ncbi:UNVERIFIED_CONTAM: rsp-3 [Trichonephila clavipes]
MSRRSQLFVGRLPLKCKEKEIEEMFEKYGPLLRCDLKYGTGMAYAFVDYEDKRDAEISRFHFKLQNCPFMKLHLVVLNCSLLVLLIYIESNYDSNCMLRSADK